MSVQTGSLVERLKARSTKAGVIGLGYVGLPLAIEFAKAGLTVVGVDLDARKVDALSKGESYIGDVAAADVKAMVEAEPSIRGIRLYVDNRNRSAQEVYARLGMEGEHYRVFEWMK